MPDLLTAVVFLPAAGALLLMLLPSDQHADLKAGALVASLITFGASLGLWAGFNPSLGGYQFAERRSGRRRHANAKGPGQTGSGIAG